MAKYTDEQVKKALECCTCHPAKCVDICPRYGDGEESWCECRWELMVDALDLINRQESEIERLMQKLQQPQSEAIKEFAERLKKSAFDCDVSFGFGREHYTEAVTVFEIDNLVNEMAGEGE